MSSLVLVGYATRYGSTQEVADAVAAAMRETGLAVDMRLLREVRKLTEYSAVVIGAPLFMFRWHNDALRFLSRHRKILTERPAAVFALGPVRDPYDAAEWQASTDQLNRELASCPWFAPVAVRMFGGKYDPSKIRFPLSLFAGSVPPSDIRDWAAIREWAASLRATLAVYGV